MLGIKPYIIGISGPSCAGKSALAHALAAQLPGSTASVPVDSYYRDLTTVSLRERADWNFDLPVAFDLELLVEQTVAIARGEPILKPIYLFPHHRRASHGERIEPGRFVIIEGLFAFYWREIRDLMHTRVFVDAPDEVCFARRVERDIRERGCSRSEVIRQYEQQVRPCYRRFIAPTRRFADLVVDGTSPVEFSVETVLRSVTPF